MAKTTIPPGGGQAILKVHLVQETDFLIARRRAKQIAELLKFDLQDQTRIATSVSEIARNAFEYGKRGSVEFWLDRGDLPLEDKKPANQIPVVDQPPLRLGNAGSLRILVIDRGPGIPHLNEIWSGTYVSRTGMGIGLSGARRLMDALDIESSPAGTRVTLVKNLPQAAPAPNLAEVSAVLAQGVVGGGSTRTNALHDQNQELLTLLGELRARETELETLNTELEETNRGVLVLYAELEDKAQAVQQASEMKTRFLSGVTHELRTPLNSVVSLSRLMLSHTDGPLNAEQEKQVTFILRSAQNLTEMVNDLLDLAKIEAGKASTNLTEFTVGELYAGLRGMFRPLAANPRVNLSFAIPETPLMLCSDQGKLAQILRNFISNALKFTEEGTIRVTATPLEGRNIRFSVADTGIGIASEHHDLVMQEWGQIQQEEHTTAGRAKGSGLGLPLSRSLAELLGGSVEFTSELGKGSTFHLTLPALALHHPVPEPSSAEEQPYILMVDDDEVARYLLRRSLEALTTTTIEEAVDGVEGLEMIGKRLPSLLFLDFSMPGMGGLEVAQSLRDNSGTATLPIVLYTSKVPTEEERRMLDGLEVTLVSKSSDGWGSFEEQKVQIERALLQVGLNNIHLSVRA